MLTAPADVVWCIPSGWKGGKCTPTTLLAGRRGGEKRGKGGGGRVDSWDQKNTSGGSLWKPDRALDKEGGHASIMSRWPTSKCKFGEIAARLEELRWNPDGRHHLPLPHCVLVCGHLDQLILCTLHSWCHASYMPYHMIGIFTCHDLPHVLEGAGGPRV